MSESPTYLGCDVMIKQKLVKNWEDFVPKKKFVAPTINRLFEYLNSVNDYSRRGLDIFSKNSSQGDWDIKPRLLDDPSNYEWYVDVDICHTGNGITSFVPCLMLLDTREKDLERSEYCDFWGGDEDPSKTLSEDTNEALVNERHDAFFVTLTYCFLVTGFEDVGAYDIFMDSMNFQIFKDIELKNNAPFMMIHEKISEKFPMKLEDFDELFGEEINQRMMIYSALS